MIPDLDIYRSANVLIDAVYRRVHVAQMVQRRSRAAGIRQACQSSATGMRQACVEDARHHHLQHDQRLHLMALGKMGGNTDSVLSFGKERLGDVGG